MADEPIKVQILGHVDTSIPGPWQTLGDYQRDRKRQAILFWIQMIVGLITIVVGLTTLLGTWKYQSGFEKTQPGVKTNSETSTKQSELPPQQPKSTLK